MSPTPEEYERQDRFRDSVQKLFGEFNIKLDRFAEKIDGRLDVFGKDVVDIRDRITKMEAQDQPGKIARLQDDQKQTYVKLDQIIRENTDNHQKIVTDAADARTKLEHRLTRMEVVIAPLTVGGSALLAAVIGAFATTLTGHVR